MSWVQFRGETWPASDAIAEIKVHLSRPDAPCARQEWSFEMMHCVRRANQVPGLGPSEKCLVLRLETLGFDLRDWRELAGRELRADAAWHERHGRCNFAGWLRESSLSAWEMIFQDEPGVSGDLKEDRQWRAHDFILRFGQRDGLSFPVELDAWLLPEKEFWRREPETPAELARFGEGPPDLRVMATAFFTDGWVMLPACGDPLALARRILREEIACEEVHEPKIQWATRPTQSVREKGEEMRDWPPTVHFRTEPGRPRRWRGMRAE